MISFFTEAKFNTQDHTPYQNWLVTKSYKFFRNDCKDTDITS